MYEAALHQLDAQLGGGIVHQNNHQCECGPTDKGCRANTCKSNAPNIGPLGYKGAWIAASGALLTRDTNVVTPIGIAPVSIEAGATVQVNTKTQMTTWLKVFWLHISSVGAASLSVSDMTIGQDQIFGNRESVPGDLFHVDNLAAANMSGFESSKINNAVDIEMKVTNNSAAAVLFTGAFLARRCC